MDGDLIGFSGKRISRVDRPWDAWLYIGESIIIYIFSGVVGGRV